MGGVWVVNGKTLHQRSQKQEQKFKNAGRAVYVLLTESANKLIKLVHATKYMY